MRPTLNLEVFFHRIPIYLKKFEINNLFHNQLEIVVPDIHCSRLEMESQFRQLTKLVENKMYKPLQMEVLGFLRGFVKNWLFSDKALERKYELWNVRIVWKIKHLSDLSEKRFLFWLKQKLMTNVRETQYSKQFQHYPKVIAH